MDFISSDSCCSSLSFELLRIAAAVLRLWRQEMSVGLREIFYVQLVGAFKRPEIEQKDPQSRADSCRATFVPLPRELSLFNRLRKQSMIYAFIGFGPDSEEMSSASVARRIPPQWIRCCDRKQMKY